MTYSTGSAETAARHDIGLTLPWMREGTAHLLAVVEGLSDDDLAAPSLLPGWSRAHVVGHLARNAEALVRLATWARTGVETPMYAGPEQRAAEIEESAAHPPQRLRAELASTARELDAALAALDPGHWNATVRSALGREIPAAELPWMRIREVWLHAVDLGGPMTALPDGVVDVLLDDVSAALSAKAGCPSVVLAPTDRERTWQLGVPGSTPPPVESGPGESVPADSAAFATLPLVSAPAVVLAGWLTGRASDKDLPGVPPELPRWL